LAIPTVGFASRIEGGRAWTIGWNLEPAVAGRAGCDAACVDTGVVDWGGLSGAQLSLALANRSGLQDGEHAGDGAGAALYPGGPGRRTASTGFFSTGPNALTISAHP